MSIAISLLQIKEQLKPYNAELVAVSKTHTAEAVLKAYNAGQRIFGENRVQELVDKYEALPKDIQWHLIGHLQSNKVKYIAPFVSLIHSVDSFALLQEINKQAIKNNRTIDCLLQLHIAQEETKFGFSYNEVSTLLNSKEYQHLSNIRIKGLMAMGSNTDNTEQIRREFRQLNEFYKQFNFKTLCMGMSSDFQIALEEGSNMLRIGSAIFNHSS
jgi:pyridoxal phosphate enzyme (YggS family)